MKKPVLGLLLGAVLGAFDGLTALATPEAAPQIVGIVIGSTIKGLIVGALVGWYAHRVRSLSKGCSWDWSSPRSSRFSSRRSRSLTATTTGSRSCCRDRSSA
jgi:hypothetical protein